MFYYGGETWNVIGWVSSSPFSVCLLLVSPSQLPTSSSLLLKNVSQFQTSSPSNLVNLADLFSIWLFGLLLCRCVTSWGKDDWRSPLNVKANQKDQFIEPLTSLFYLCCTWLHSFKTYFCPLGLFWVFFFIICTGLSIKMWFCPYIVLCDLLLLCGFKVEGRLEVLEWLQKTGGRRKKFINISFNVILSWLLWNKIQLLFQNIIVCQSKSSFTV